VVGDCSNTLVLLFWNNVSREPCNLLSNVSCNLQRELAEVWAASKQLPTVGSSQHKDHSQQLQQQPILQDALARLENTRKSNEKRKLSTERKYSSELSSSDQQKSSDVAGGSRDSAAGLWGTQGTLQHEQDHHSVCGSENTPCLRWFPYRVSSTVTAQSPPLGVAPELGGIRVSLHGVSRLNASGSTTAVVQCSAQVQQGPADPSCFSSCLLLILHQHLAVLACRHCRPSQG
jgi:hypothetical protein